MAGYDCVLLGAGHNSLILQAYLGRAGLRTVCLERLSAAGGELCTTESESLLSFLRNTHSFFHRGVTGMPWYHDLELERRVAEYIEPKLNAAMLLPGGDALECWTQSERTDESFARFSRQAARSGSGPDRGSPPRQARAIH